MTEWKTYTLKELSKGRGEYGIGAPAVPFDKEKYTYLRITDINDDGTLNTSGMMSVDADDAEEYILEKNDIVFARTGNSTGRSYFYDGRDGELVYAGFLIRFRLDETKVNPKILKYYTHSKPYYDWVKSFDTGGTRGNINAKTYGDMPLYLPPRHIQDRIVGILSSIDDKIENNRRINDNLEQQAQALYKQWFVDNRSDDWEEKPLSEIAEFVGGYSYKGNELVESSSTAMATIKNFERKGGFKVDGFKDIVASPKLKAEQHAELFDILVAHTDLTQNADVIGNAEILLTFGGYTDVIFSMDLVKVLPKSNFPYKYLLAALLKNPYFKAHCLGYVNGTTVLHMSKKALPEYVVACPPNSEAEKMDMAFKVYYHKMAEILQENKTLATLRDTLLPKLMNGEIKL